MASLSDLKNDGNEGKEPFVPYVKDDSEEVVEIKEEKEIPTESEEEQMITQPGISFQKKPTTVNVPKERVKADFSKLPKKKEDGVDVKISPQHDLLGIDENGDFIPDGPFASYIAEKKKEAQEYMANQEAEAEMEGKKIYNATVGLTPDIPPESEEEKEVEETDKVELTPAPKLKKETIDIFDEEEDNMAEENVTNVEEVVEEPVVEEIKEEVTSEPENVIDEDDFPVDDEDLDLDVDDEPEITPVVEKSTPVAAPAEISEDEFEEEIDIDVHKERLATDEESADDDDDELDIDTKAVPEVDSSEDQSLVMLKKQITEKIKPVSKKYDLSGFTVASKPVVSNAIIQTKEISTAKWVLLTTGTTFMVRELLGSDLERLRMVMQSNDARGTLQTIYDAITSPKPSFEKWMKSVAFDDYDHLFMGLYIAAFNGSNFMPVDCTNDKCEVKNYVTDDMKFTNLVKYKDDEAKKKFMKLYREEPTEVTGLRPTEIVPISHDYAIGFVTPSLYSIMIETGYFDSDFQRKYASAISIAPYIDRIYQIDWNTKQFIPVAYKEYANNDAKNAKSKIVKYNKIFATLNSDEIAIIRAYMESINDGNDLVTYQQPETVCPHCGNVNKAIESSAASMLFLRVSLAMLTNT